MPKRKPAPAPVRAVAGVPRPPAVRGLYPWRTMAVGESFPAAGGAPASVRAMASRRGRELGRTFSVAVVDGVPTVWRTA